ncbi:beta-propeller domain-containing protein, partial [Candidatus Bathyarchaeota archaeon]|nr:beta-propeller domain-containing protein [Candidatus Bathyarchaeota archaeon]
KISEIEATRIFYSNVSDDYYTFTTYIGLNILDNEQDPTNMTIMTGSTSNMYVSPGNVYVTYWSRDGTEIHRIRIDEGGFAFEAEGKVPGYVLNQFSMDENNEYFRLATNSRTNGIQQNNVYVLNMNLSLVGKLENLAVGEDLHSARFMGDKCYLVTFETVDPLFVIDLSQPNDPKVLGELKIPGYSDYLHPYDENHLIGVGKETVEAIETDWAWYQGVKLSLFDVSNVNDPKQLDTYVIGDRGTDSPILWDHKAFLFDKPKNLLVIPVTLAEIDKTVYPPDPRNYGTFVWQGAYVFGLTTGDGFVLRGTITHVERDLHDSNYWINRALYIGNVLYTVSNQKVVLNNLTDLSPILEVYLK